MHDRGLHQIREEEDNKVMRVESENIPLDSTLHKCMLSAYHSHRKGCATDIYIHSMSCSMRHCFGEVPHYITASSKLQTHTHTTSISAMCRQQINESMVHS